MKGEADEMVKRVFFNLKQFLQREKGREVADEGEKEKICLRKDSLTSFFSLQFLFFIYYYYFLNRPTSDWVDPERTRVCHIACLVTNPQRLA
jgi:hypothetical protein